MRFLTDNIAMFALVAYIIALVSFRRNSKAF